MDQLALSTEAAMSALGGTDNVLLKQAEAYLKVFLNKKAAGATLFVLLQHSSNTVVRQLSAVLLRPKLISFWNRITPQQREELKSTLIRRLAEEPARGVRKAVVSLIVALGKALLPGGNWPELAAAISASAKHPSEDVRELGMVLVKDLVDSMGPGGASQGGLAEPFKMVIGEALADAKSKKVRAAALRAMGALLRSIGDKKGIAAFKDVLPVMMGVTQQCLDDLQEDAVADSLGTLHDLIEYDSPILTPHIESVARFLINVMNDDRVEDSTKDAASESLICLIEAKPKTFVKKGLVDAVSSFRMDERPGKTLVAVLRDSAFYFHFPRFFAPASFLPFHFLRSSP
jgi:Importin-beta N-terminal domain